MEPINHQPSAVSNSEDGQALVIVLLALLLGVLLVSGFLYFAGTSQRATTAAINQTTQRYSSDAGIERGLWWLQYGDLTQTLTTIGSSVMTQTQLNNFTVTIIITANTNMNIVVIPPPSQITLDKAVTPATFPGAGQPVTYTIMITNAGPSNTRVQQITDTLPAGFTYVTTTATSVSRFPDAIHVSGQTLTWSYSSPRPSIPAGSTATLTFVATSGATSACNSAGVTIQGSIGLVARSNLACLDWPEYWISAQTGPQTILVRVRLVNGLPVILSWEFLP